MATAGGEWGLIVLTPICLFSFICSRPVHPVGADQNLTWSPPVFFMYVLTVRFSSVIVLFQVLVVLFVFQYLINDWFARLLQTCNVFTICLWLSLVGLHLQHLLFECFCIFPCEHVCLTCVFNKLILMMMFFMTRPDLVVMETVSSVWWCVVLVARMSFTSLVSSARRTQRPYLTWSSNVDRSIPSTSLTRMETLVSTGCRH